MAKVTDILSRKGSDVFTVDPDTTVYDAIGTMVDRGVGSLLVVREKEILGILTERDYLRKVALEGRSSRETPVREIMSSNIICIGKEHDVEEVLAIMSEARIRHLPVLDGSGLAGLVSIGDCVKQVSRDREAQVRYLTDYIADGYPG